jgi:hypothetical protein
MQESVKMEIERVLAKDEPSIERGGYDQVLFMGAREFHLKGFIASIPLGNGFTRIIFKEPSEKLGIAGGKENYTNQIEDIRIKRNINLTINGKKTLPVFADIRAGNINQSFLDAVVASYMDIIKDVNRENERLSRATKRFEEFLKIQHIGQSYIEFIQNMVKQGKIIATSTAKPEAEHAPVTVEVGKEKK